MKPQIFTLDTMFMVGKHKGTTLRSVIEAYQSRYVGFLIFYNISWFIMHPDTVKFLEKDGFFDDLDMSYYGNGGSMPLSWVGYNKEKIIDILESNYEIYIKDPNEYERKAKEKTKAFTRTKNMHNQSQRLNSDDDNDVDEIHNSDYIDEDYNEPLDEEEMIMRALENGNGEPLGYGLLIN